MRSNLLCWLDDILLHESSAESLPKTVEQVFSFCGSHNLILHPNNCVLFSKEIRWCGRLLSASGIRFDPRRLEALITMQPSTTGGHLQQIICALQWVRQDIPSFNHTILRLQDVLDKVYEHAKARTKRAVSRVTLTTVGLGEAENHDSQVCKKALVGK